MSTHRPKFRPIAVLPTLFTLGNLVCGFFAIVVVSRVERPTSPDVPSVAAVQAASPVGLLKQLDPSEPVYNVMLGGWLILLAMLFDALDGHVARLSRSTSDFGGQLDSLADVITFGVAPAFLLVKMCPQFAFLHREAMWAIAAAFAACAALRLARFNVENSADDDHLQFHGLPTPAAASSIAGFAIMFHTLYAESSTLPYAQQISSALQVVLPFFALLVALLMVSRIPYPHVVNQVVRGHRSFGHVVSLVFALAAIMVVRGFAIPTLCCAFVLGSPIRYAWQALLHRKAQREPLF